MYERVDTSSTVEIKQDQILKAALLAAMLVMSVFVVWELWSDPLHWLQPGIPKRDKLLLSMYLFLIVALPLSALAAFQLVTMRGTILTISPLGICDRRFSVDTVPWSKVNGVGEWQSPNKQRARWSRVVTLSLTAPIADILRLRPLARWSTFPVGQLGSELKISAGGIKASYEDIRNLITAFAKAHANLDLTPSSRLVRQS